MLRLMFAVATTLALTALTWRKRRLIRAILEDLLDKGVELTVNHKYWPSKSEQDADVPVVYVTEAGSKYHRSDCRFLNGDARAISLEKAAEAYSACGTCQPDA